jgi:hypothetical protein
MSLQRKTLVPLTGVAVIALVALLGAPRAVHAITATLVQVVNTEASPAITQDTSREASQIVSLYCGEYPLLCYQIQESGGIGTTAYAVPAGFHLVIKSVEIFVATPFTPGTQLYLKNTATGEPFEYFDIPSEPLGNSCSFTPGISVGPGTALSIGEAFLSSGGSVIFYMHGYLTSK